MLNEKSLSGHAVVVGAGVMGAGIAALLANAGWRVDLLDRADDGPDRDWLAREGLERAVQARPPHFALPEYATRVRVGNIEEAAGRMRAADWIVEAVAEERGVKQAVMALIAAHAGPEAVVSSNTSGLSLAGMVADCPPEFRARFLGTHFFNPPRYMKPLELIPTADTNREVFEGFARFAERVLGKRIVRAKDTPGFISTRLGMYALAKTLEIAAARGLTVEETDYLTGPLIGHPGSGSFRLADLIGLDTFAHIIENLAADLPEDRAYQALRLPEAMRRLIADGRAGAKTGAGFYRKENSGAILSLDLAAGEYRPRREPTPYPQEIESLPLGPRLRRLWEMSPEQDGGFLRDVLRATLGYMAGVTPEVADRIVEVDDALMGGFGWEMGPFHMLDALHEALWPRGEGEARAEPLPVQRLRQAHRAGFYQNEAGHHEYFDFHTLRMTSLHRPPEMVVLKDMVKAGRAIEENDRTALVDLGRGVLCAVWRAKLNVLDPEIIAFLGAARARAEQDYAALVIGGGEPFSVGYNLHLFAARIEAQDWDGIEAMLRQFQDTLRGLQAATVPVVCAVSGYALGGGCELLLRGAAAQAAFESYIGLPEANVGLIPAGGGVTTMLHRALAAALPGPPAERTDLYPLVRPVWEALRRARVSTSADEARVMGCLRPSDGITRHPDHLLHDARECALALAETYRPPAPPTLAVMGEEGLSRFRWELHLLQRAGQITAHDARVADHLAQVLCGGALIHPAEVSESYLLEREREAFLSLAGMPETLARIRHLLATGKPLRN